MGNLPIMPWATSILCLEQPPYSLGNLHIIPWATSLLFLGQPPYYSLNNLHITPLATSLLFHGQPQGLPLQITILKINPLHIFRKIFSQNTCIFPKNNILLHSQFRNECPDGGIGRRAGLKHQWGNPSRFDPGSGYKERESEMVLFFYALL